MIFLLAVLLSAAHAQSPVPALISIPALEGQYKSESTVQGQKRFSREFVASSTVAGARRLVELRSQGFGCKLLMDQRHLCSRAESAEFPPELSQRVIAREQGKAEIKIGAETAPVTLLHESDFYSEWLVQRPIAFAGQNCPSFRFMKGIGFEKLRSTESCGQFEFVYSREKNALATQVHATRTEEPFEAVYVGLLFRSPAL
jgi:hypothetical protein